MNSTLSSVKKFPSSFNYEDGKLYTVELYTLPLALFAGTLCNVMVLLVMRRQILRGDSICFYMAVLAISDEMVLIFEIANFWAYLKWHTNMALLSHLSCRFMSLLYLTIENFSNWIELVMTIEAYIYVTIPLQAVYLCTVRRAKITTSLIACTILLINAYHSFLHIIDEFGCDIPDSAGDNYMIIIWPWINATIYICIPLFLLIGFDVLLFVKLLYFKSDDDYQSVQAHSSRAADDNLNVTITQNLNSPVVASRTLTIMVLVVSIVHLITSIPVLIFQYDESGFSSSLKIARVISITLQLLNNSINFFLYAITSAPFRDEFLRIFKFKEEMVSSSLNDKKRDNKDVIQLDDSSNNLKRKIRI